MNEPMYLHDCTDCYFVGVDRPVAGERLANAVDMYIHVSPSNTTLIRRYSSEPSDYRCMANSDHLPEIYQRVSDAAGIITNKRLLSVWQNRA